MQSDVQVDVFVGNYTLIDPDIYDLWLSGKNAQEASNALTYLELKQNEALEIFTAQEVTNAFTYLGLKQNEASEMLTSHICDQYRLFQMLERLLYSPSKMGEQWTFQVTASTQQMLIEKYYEFDSSVVREFLGKKMSSRHRKDLDEVSERTGIPIKSCRRQFDNVKRVYKTVEDCNGELVQIIQNYFSLSEKLSRKYAAVVYIANNKFETGKRKLQYLTFDDFLYCANQMMLKWSCVKDDCKYEETAMEIDREFLQNLRDTKAVLDKDTVEELKHSIFQFFRVKSCDLPSDWETNYKVISRTLISIANGLNHSKELKDLFIDIVEKIVEPIRYSRWSDQELQQFLDAYTRAVIHLDIVKCDPQLARAWERYMSAMSDCILKMYHS